MKLTKVNFAIAWLVLSLLLVPVFAMNALGTASEDFYKNWQLESDVLAVAKLQAGQNDVDIWKYGLLVAQPNQMAPLYPEQSQIQGWAGNSTEDFVPYTSQLGLQGKVLLALNSFGISDFNNLQAINAIIFSFVFAFFVLIISKITTWLFSACVLATTVFSPWMVVASHSLFWAAWSWFLPAIFSYFFVTSKRPISKLIFALMVILSFVFRFGSGYEFITSFTLLTAGIPLVILFFGNKEFVLSAKEALFYFFTIFALAISAFLITLSIHANLRGDGNLFKGIVNIVNEDVLRRTYGDPGVWANPEIQESLVASPLSVIKKYLFNWNTDFLVAGSQSPFTFIFGPQSPWFLITISIGILTFQLISKSKLFVLNSFLFLWACSIPFSWYLLAKSHSYIHTQINFVLWYLFFAAVLFYIPISALVQMVRLKYKPIFS
jgi:hypothetical protein